MAKTKRPPVLFPNNHIADGRLKMLCCVFPKKSEETILAEALEMYYKSNQAVVARFTATLSSYATENPEEQSPGGTA